MTEIARYLGVALMSGAFVIAGTGVLYVIYIWITKIIPFFWEQGNPWPALVPLAIAMLGVGGVLMAITEKDGKGKDHD